MAILVTGGAGFIGTYVVRRLLTRGERVVVYDVVPTPNVADKVLTDEERRCVPMVQGDVADLGGLLHTVRSHSVTTIVHLAALLIPACQADPAAAVRVNCLGLVHALEAARLFGLRRVVWASSVAVFGPPERYTDLPVKDDAPHFPTTIYGASKSFGERLLEHYFRAFGVEGVALRFPVVYGLGRTRGASAFIMELFEAPARGRPCTIPFGDDALDWQYVEDAAAAILLACDAPAATGRTYNATGEYRSLKEAVECVRRLLPGVEITLGPGRTGMVWRFDGTDAAADLGYRPRFGLEHGFRETINAIRSRAGLPSI
jgi:nucleoside-diphosphate-sugar epimerase